MGPSEIFAFSSVSCSVLANDEAEFGLCLITNLSFGYKTTLKVLCLQMDGNVVVVTWHG